MLEERQRPLLFFVFFCFSDPDKYHSAPANSKSIYVTVLLAQMVCCHKLPSDKLTPEPVSGHIRSSVTDSQYIQSAVSLLVRAKRSLVAVVSSIFVSFIYLLEMILEGNILLGQNKSFGYNLGVELL